MQGHRNATPQSHVPVCVNDGQIKANPEQGLWIRGIMD